MSKVNELKQNIRRRFKKFSTNEDMENENLNRLIDEEKKCVHWTVENLHVCPLKTGEYLESSPFYSGYMKGTKWALRLYPKGRNTSNSEKVGLFIFKISSTAKCSVKYQFTLEDVNSINVCFDNKSVFEVLEEYGTEELLSSEDLSKEKVLKIECNMVIRYSDEIKKYQLSDKGFSNCTCALSRDLKDLYLKEEHTDAFLQVKGMKFPVHKAILGARSKEFADIFMSNQREETFSNVFPIDDPIEESDMRNLLQYIYTSNTDALNVDRALNLYPVAKKYSLVELQNLCLKVILSAMSVENFCGIAALADTYPSPKLKIATKNFFCNFASQILEREEWNSFVRDKRMMALEMLNTLSSEYKTKCLSVSYSDTGLN